MEKKFTLVRSPSLSSNVVTRLVIHTIMTTELRSNGASFSVMKKYCFTSATDYCLLPPPRTKLLPRPPRGLLPPRPPAPPRAPPRSMFPLEAPPLPPRPPRL